MTRLCRRQAPTKSGHFNYGPGKLPQGLPKFKRALWGDKPEGLLPENCPNFFFFFVWAGTLWALVTSPLRVLKEVRPDFGPGKLQFSQGKFSL
jgi:hypothetical protein